MKRIHGAVRPVVFTGEDGDTLTIRTTNRGEPFRTGVDLEFCESPSTYEGYVTLFLPRDEIESMRDFLDKYLKESKR